jgi:hypothetical protein
VKSRLDARGGVRVVGRPQTRVRTIGLLPGTRSIQDTVALLPQVDAIIAGEIREWESSEYARDVVNAGLGKALILVGRSLSEDAGMKVCADWLRTIVPEAPFAGCRPATRTGDRRHDRRRGRRSHQEEPGCAVA